MAECVELVTNMTDAIRWLLSNRSLTSEILYQKLFEVFRFGSSLKSSYYSHFYLSSFLNFKELARGVKKTL
jgi:hypothetical protein